MGFSPTLLTSLPQERRSLEVAALVENATAKSVRSSIAGLVRLSLYFEPHLLLITSPCSLRPRPSSQGTAVKEYLGFKKPCAGVMSSAMRAWVDGCGRSGVGLGRGERGKGGRIICGYARLKWKVECGREARVPSL